MIPIGARVTVEGKIGVVLASDLSWPYVLVGFPDGTSCRYNAAMMPVLPIT